MSALEPADVAKLLGDIYAGRVSLFYAEPPESVRSRDVLYETSNGWRLRVFADGCEFDYLDEVISPNGERLAFDALNGDEVASVLHSIDGEPFLAAWGFPAINGDEIRPHHLSIVPSITDRWPAP
jgi:hypothetical protein